MSRTRRHRVGLVAIAALLATPVMSARPAPPKPEGPPWQPFHYFLDTWEGTGSSFGNTSRTKRVYRFVVGNKFLWARNESVFDAKAGEERGEVHEDMSMLGWDKRRETFVLREFHSEGIVSQYVLKELTEQDGRGRFVFETEHIENMAPGWRARVTIEILDDDQFEEVFALAAPDADFKPCVSNRLRRKTD